MHRRVALALMALAIGAASIAGTLIVTTSRVDAEEPKVSQDLGQATAAGAPLFRVGKPLRGIVLAWEGNRVVRIAGAHIGTGETSVQTDRAGRFTIPATIRTNALNVVAPGYEVVREESTGDYRVICLRPLDVRAIYIPYDMLRRQSVLEWALGLARDGTISSLVIDVKDEGGSVLPLVANETARAIGAVRSTHTDVEAFLDELERLGVYRIARVVTFLDAWLAYNVPDAALRQPDGTVFRDSLDLAWTSPFSAEARRHNIEIGVIAARYFEEIQYDYVRLPTDPNVAVRDRATAAERSGAIVQFAKEASAALHAVGAAISFDTFGQTTIIFDDGGIGQILEDLAPHLDYYSPMVYPSTWTAGWFDLLYPPADPYAVVLGSVGAAVTRLAPLSNIVVRPWLQDFHDYQERKLWYGAREVRAQIEASASAGGQGFMLWDLSLNYQTELLDELRGARAALP